MELTLAQKQEAIRNKVAQCIALAESKFKIAMPKVAIRFDLRGRAAGQACASGYILTRTYWHRYNLTHMMVGGKSWDHLLNNTVSHEVAHTVCQAFPNLGKNHDAGWKRVCLALGGNGQTRYSQEEAPEAVAINKPFVYTTTSGHTVNVSPIIHRKIQNLDMSYIFRGKGKVNKQCSYNMASATPPKAIHFPPSPAGIPKTATFTLPPVAKPNPTVGSNADRMREFIRINKAIHGSKAFELAVDFGVTVLGQKRALAKSYVQNNWSKA